MSNAPYWHRITQQRVTRRRLLQASGALTVAAGAAALVGCGDSKNTGSSSPSPEVTVPSRSDGPDRLNVLNPPVPGGTYVTANSANFGSWDPHVGIQVASAYFPRIYNLLLSQSPTKPEYRYMDLATSVETPDDMTYVFKIRPGVKIAPNDMGIPERDLDGEDVKATFERLKTDATTNAYSFANKYIDSVSVSGDTVTIKTTEPYAWFIQRISGYNSVVPPREIVADPSKVQNKGAGGGPYSVTSVSENDVAQLTRNPNFYRRDPANNDAQLPYLDNLEVRVIYDRATQRTAFLSGQMQQYWAQNGEEARSLGDYPLARDPVFAFVSMTMNPLRAPFTDPRARRAVSRAINRQQIVDIVYSGDAQPNGLVHWPLGSYALPPGELESTYQPFDLADARALAEAAGGVKLKLTYPANTTIQEHGDHLSVFVEQMRAAGIEVEEVPLEFSNWVTSYHDLQYDCSLGLNQIYETPELPLLFHVTGGPFGDDTYIQGLKDAEVDAAVRKANTTLDLDAQIEAVRDAQRVIYGKDPGFLPLVGPYLHMVYAKAMHNVPTGVGTTSYSLADYWMET